MGETEHLVYIDRDRAVEAIDSLYSHMGDLQSYLRTLEKAVDDSGAWPATHESYRSTIYRNTSIAYMIIGLTETLITSEFTHSILVTTRMQRGIDWAIALSEGDGLRPPSQRTELP